MIWTRTAKMFFEEIDSNRKDNITGQKHRFELCEEFSKLDLDFPMIKNLSVHPFNTVETGFVVAQLAQNGASELKKKSL